MQVTGQGWLKNFLNGSFALSDTDTWAVGESTKASAGTEAPLALNWNGTTWSSVPTPTPSGSTPAWLFESVAVTAKSDSDVWVFSNTGSPSVPLLLANWNGSSWTTSASPLPADTEASIGSATSSPSHVWLFGTYLSASAGDQPMILSHS
jgi:hypothetical protein